MGRKVNLFVLCVFSILSFVKVRAQDGVSKNCFKVTMLSLGSGSSRFSFERAFSDHLSAEITYGAIGLGWDWMNNSDPKGYIIKCAPKLNGFHRQAANSWLDGLYFKPEFLYANYRYDVQKKGHAEFGRRKHTSQCALIAEAGYQLLAWGWFIFDVYVGLGPSWGNRNANNYYHGFMLFPEEGNLAFTAGYRVGIAF